MLMPFHSFCMTLLLIGPAVLFGGPGSADSVGDEANGFVAAVLDTDCREHTGRLTEWSNGQIVLDSNGLQTFSQDRLIRLDFSECRPGSYLRDSYILLANGDRLVATLLEVRDDQILACFGGLASETPISIPLETVRAVLLVAGPSPRRRVFLTGLMKPNPANDVVLTRNGDRVDGEFKKLGEDSLTIKTASGEIDLPRDGVDAIVFNPELISFPPSRSRESLLTLRNGSHLTARDVCLMSNDQIEYEAAFGRRIRLPVRCVASVRFLGQRVAYLSDVTPDSYEHTPYVSGSWKLARDRNVLGGPLRLRGLEFAKGLGMHSRSAVTYDLDGKYRHFHAFAGLDDESGPLASAVFAVLLDAKPAWKSELLTLRDRAVAVGPIDVRGIRKLTLVVDFGEFADVEDRADWCDAVLVR